MRIWDIDPGKLCRSHLLGEHRELHAIWTILTEGKKGYSRHPETLRWNNKLKALYRRHAKLVAEMQKRSFLHKSELNRAHATGSGVQRVYVDPLIRQKSLLRSKKCACKV
ncbi:MAG: pyrimidine dimer DNA glycosylase/endonuclease V [Candidatus Omnitrophota bacterium]|nr:pyrimidine dimer DNA glycosylase/endonuclease V [Candidatus Omnitrophota bacterium]